MVENGGVASSAMLEVGYSKNTAKTPQKLTGSKGFIELCDELGLTDNFLTTALVEDIKEKKGNRKPELELGFKVRGRLKEKEEDKASTITNFTQIIINGANTGNKSDAEATLSVAGVAKS